MERCYDKEVIDRCLARTKHGPELEELKDCLFVAEYGKGELLTSPFQSENLFQIVIDGTLNSYFIMDDGSVYSLADGQKDYLICEMEIFKYGPGNVYAEASDNLTCLAISIGQCRTRMLDSCCFLRLLCESLTGKIEAMTTLDAAPASLSQRVLTYMKFKCAGKELKGLQQAAFHLNCSSRQLQRILNRYETEGIVEKTGKGAYRLISSEYGMMQDDKMRQ